MISERLNPEFDAPADTILFISQAASTGTKYQFLNISYVVTVKQLNAISYHGRQQSSPFDMFSFVFDFGFF